TWVLKTAVARPRPYEDPASCASHWFSVSACVSFPSGHTSTAFAVARVLAEEYPERKWLWYALALLVSWSRVENRRPLAFRRGGRRFTGLVGGGKRAE